MNTRALIYLFLFAIIVAMLAFLIIYFYFPRDTGMGRGVGLQFHVWVPVLLLPVTFAIGLLTYLALFPDIKQKPSAEMALPRDQRSMEAVMKVLRDDERKVVELLINAGGTMLQRDIARETGFTRVKTHRILHRLSVRGIITAKKCYNTYQITLADWLLSKD